MRRRAQIADFSATDRSSIIVRDYARLFYLTGEHTSKIASVWSPSIVLDEGMPDDAGSIAIFAVPSPPTTPARRAREVARPSTPDVPHRLATTKSIAGPSSSPRLRPLSWPEIDHLDVDGYFADLARET